MESLISTLELDKRAVMLAFVLLCISLSTDALWIKKLLFLEFTQLINNSRYSVLMIRITTLVLEHFLKVSKIISAQFLAILKHPGSSRFGKEDPGYLRRCLQVIFSTFFFLKLCKEDPGYLKRFFSNFQKIFCNFAKKTQDV